MDLVTTTNATLTAVSKALDYFKNNVAGHFTDQSLTSITKLTRAEPLTIISHDCANLEYLPDLLNNVASIYSGYFLQAVSMLNWKSFWLVSRTVRCVPSTIKCL